MDELISVSCIQGYGDGDYVGIIILPGNPNAYGFMLPVDTYNQIREGFGWPPSPCGGIGD